MVRVNPSPQFPVPSAVIPTKNSGAEINDLGIQSGGFTQFDTASNPQKPFVTSSGIPVREASVFQPPVYQDGLELMMPMVSQILALLKTLANHQQNNFRTDTPTTEKSKPDAPSKNNAFPMAQDRSFDWSSQPLNAQGEYNEIPEIPGGPDTPDSPDTPDTGGQAPINKNQPTPPPLPIRGKTTERRHPDPEIPDTTEEPSITEQKDPVKPDPIQTVSNKNSEPPPDAINAKDFGVVGDGKTDDQAALQKAFDAAKAAGKPLYLGPGTYNHSGVLTLDGATLVGAGDKTVLNATSPDQGAIKLTGNSPYISNLKTTFSSAPTRSSMPDAAAVLIQNASGANVKDMTIQGAQSNGVRIDSSSGSKVTNNLVLGTNADGIAVMNGSSNNLIQNNVVYQASDDSFSDNSYTGDHAQDSGNVFDSNLSLDNAYGRGMCFAGSANVTITNNIISGSKWIGIFADTDPNSGTMESTGHKIENNTVINSPNGAPVQKSASSSESGTSTSGFVPDLASILGWDPGKLPDRTSFNSGYQPGTGSGANNTAGNRS